MFPVPLLTPKELRTGQPRLPWLVSPWRMPSGTPKSQRHIRLAAGFFRCRPFRTHHRRKTLQPYRRHFKSGRRHGGNCGGLGKAEVKACSYSSVALRRSKASFGRRCCFHHMALICLVRAVDEPVVYDDGSPAFALKRLVRASFVCRDTPVFSAFALVCYSIIRHTGILLSYCGSGIDSDSPVENRPD